MDLDVPLVETVTLLAFGMQHKATESMSPSVSRHGDVLHGILGLFGRKIKLDFGNSRIEMR